MTFSQIFPPVYSPWLASRLAGEVRETLATCDQCAMARPSGLTRDPGPFAAHLKCCTYFPFVPNFGVGALLNSHSPDIELRLQTAAGQGLLLPLGLYATPERQSLMAGRGGEGNGFGQRADLLCPFYNTAVESCAIWAYRPGVCTTYFCKSDRGAAGLAFWQDVENYLNYFEWVLAQEVFQRVGLGENEMEMCKAIMSTTEDEEERRYFFEYAWGKWASKKEEFFITAAQAAAKIEPHEVDALLGPEYLKLEQSLRDRL